MLADLQQARWIVESVTTKERKKGAVPPFITSKLQQASRFPGQEDDDDCAAALRRRRAAGRRSGRSHHLHAHRLDARRRIRRSTECAQFIGDDVRRRLRARRSRTSIKTKADAQDAHEAIRPTSMQYHPDAVRAQLTRRSVLPLQVDLEPVRRVADAAGDVRRNDGRHRGGRLSLPRQGLGAEVRRLDGGLQPGARRPSERTDGPGTRRARRRTTTTRPGAAGAVARRRADAARAEAGAEVHAAAAALQRGDAREGARGERHRPAEHLRLDHHGDPGARLREQDRRPVQADDARHDAGREAAQPGVRRHPRRRVHARSWRSSSTRSRRARPTTRARSTASTRSSRRI